MQPMSAARFTMWRIDRAIMTGLLLTIGCRNDTSRTTSDSAATLAATADTTEMAIVPCGRAQATRCKGELVDNWNTDLSGNALAVAIDGWQHALGFGRPQMRRTLGSSPAHYSAFTLIYPLDDAHTIRPDKIGGPTVFAILIPIGPDKEHKWGLDPAGYSRYIAVLDPSNDVDKSTWHLERVYWDGNRWQRSAVAGTGKWRTCPEKHTPKDFAYADFLRCDQQPLLPPQLLSLGLSTKSAQSMSALTELPTAFNALKRDGEEPIWIFCPAGCCEAEW
jgi:hypothetical protein